MKNPNSIKKMLCKDIKSLEKNIQLFVKNPEKDFTRNRKLPFQQIMKLILALEKETIKKLYAMRWRIETSFCTLKHTLGAATLHSKKYEYVLQEIWARMILYNFCSEIIKCTRVKESGKKLKYKINISQAMKMCRQFLKSLIETDIILLMEKFILPIRKKRLFKRRKRTSLAVSLNYR